MHELKAAMKALDACGNSITDWKDLSSFESLEVLVLRDNRLSSDLMVYHSYSTVCVNFNIVCWPHQITTPVFLQVQRLTSLRHLDVSRNQVTTLAFLEGLPLLLTLDASYNGLKVFAHSLAIAIIAYTAWLCRSNLSDAVHMSSGPMPTGLHWHTNCKFTAHINRFSYISMFVLALLSLSIQFWHSQYWSGVNLKSCQIDLLYAKPSWYHNLHACESLKTAAQAHFAMIQISSTEKKAMFRSCLDRPSPDCKKLSMHWNCAGLQTSSSLPKAAKLEALT